MNTQTQAFSDGFEGLDRTTARLEVVRRAAIAELTEGQRPFATDLPSSARDNHQEPALWRPEA